jgi:hypothetical protein
LKDPIILPFRKAGDRIRTGDIQLGKLTLYQLSYTRILRSSLPRGKMDVNS